MGLAESVTLRVHNGGEPIAAARLPLSFEPMQRAALETGNPSRSVGLGLYIVGSIVHARGGTVSVTSTADDGTTVTVTLPRSPAEGASAPEDVTLDRA